MYDLRSAIETETSRIAADLASAILSRLSAASFQEISQLLARNSPAPAPTEAPPSPRTRTTEDLEEVLALVVGELGRHPRGLRKEGLRSALSLGPSKEAGVLLSKALHVGLESDQITKIGDRRATTYLLPSEAQAKGRVIRRKKS